MEEQRQRQEDEARRAQANEAATNKQPETIKEVPNEEAMLKRALAMSLEGAEDSTSPATDNTAPTSGNVPDFARMTEEEQIAFAMQMSMQDQRMCMKYSCVRRHVQHFLICLFHFFLQKNSSP